MSNKPYVKEIVLTILTFVWLLFVATNVNQILGNIYLQFTAGSLLLLIIGITIFDKRLNITFQKQPGGNLKAIAMGFVGWIILLIVSVIVLGVVNPAQASIGAIIRLMGATTPALATSKIANLITFGVAIAYIETVLWARLLEFFSDLFNIPLEKRGLVKIFTALVLLIIMLAFGFVLFHLTSKGVLAIGPLIVVFIMMLISLIMIVIFQETRQAIYLHVWANTVASYLTLFVVGAI